jgi:hypothetical protein
VIVVHQVYNKCTPPLHMGWAPHTVGLTPCEGVVYICCTLGVQLSLFYIYIYIYPHLKDPCHNIFKYTLRSRHPLHSICRLHYQSSPTKNWIHRERERERERLGFRLERMLCAGRVLAVSYPPNPPCPNGCHFWGSRFRHVNPYKLSSRWRSRASDPDSSSSSFAPSIDSDPTDKTAAG